MRVLTVGFSADTLEILDYRVHTHTHGTFVYEWLVDGGTFLWRDISYTAQT